MVKQLLGFREVTSCFEAVGEKFWLPSEYAFVCGLPCRVGRLPEVTVSKLGLLGFLSEKMRAGNEV